MTDTKLERRRTKTRTKLRRPRKRRTIAEQPVAAGVPSVEHHDVLFIAPKGVHEDDEYFRFPVVKAAPLPVNPGEIERDSHEPGTFVDAPEKMDFYDYGQRKAISFSNPAEWGPAGATNQPRGPAIATIPVKPEPAATSCGVCYLIDAQNLNFRNPWTAEEWNQLGGLDLPADPLVGAKGFDVLLAGPQGKVFHLVLKLEDGQTDLWKAKPCKQIADGAGHIECIDLRFQAEIWNQLRNGCVAGRVLLDDRFGRHPGEGRRVVPLVNITTLMSAEEENRAGAEADS